MKFNVYISACHETGGIYRYILDQDGKLTHAGTTPLENPMYLVESGGRMHTLLKSCFDDGCGGYTSFKINPDGSLSDMSEIVSTKGLVPCHLAVCGDDVYAVNYSSGSVIKLPHLLKVHQGSGPNLPRQDMAHTHFVGPTPSGKLIAVTDLGTDEIYFYDKHMNLQFKVKTPEGSGVRHLAFSGNSNLMYAVTELHSTVCVYTYGDAPEDFRLIGEYKALPDDFTGQNTAAAIRLHEGKLYVSNRGHNSIVCFDICGNKLKKARTINCGGKGPRDFDIFGNFMVVTNENSQDIVVFDMNTLEITDRKEAPAPISVVAREI